MKKYLLWRHSECDGSQVHLFIGLNAGEDYEQAWEENSNERAEMRMFQSITWTLGSTGQQLAQSEYDRPLILQHNLNTSENPIMSEIFQFCSPSYKIKSVSDKVRWARE